MAETLCPCHGSCDPHHTESAQRYQEYYHGLHRLAGSSDRSAKHMQDSKHPVERAEIFHNIYTIFHHLMVRCKDSDYLRSEYQQHNSGYHRIPGPHCCGYVHSFSDPVCFPCANILPGKCSCSHTDTQYRQDIESIDFYISCKTGHNCRSKTVHTCLHDQV